MSEKIVVNTSPIIAFEKMQALNVISQLPFEFVCPAEVEAEIAAGTAKALAASLPSWIRVLSLSAPLSPLILASLDSGEAAVIELALE
jgi:predicted nucleic acid-binding protein